jgi:signal transduction histidine kinase
VVRTTSLPADERAHWERRGIDSALLIPLLAPGDVHIGVLVATFRKRRRFSKTTVRAYSTVGAQAALALENMRLVEEARQAGQQTGVLLERQRLAREIHDTLAQGFTGIITNLSAAQLVQSRVSADEASTRHLEAAKRIARESLAEARRFVWALRPEWLDRRSLSEALDRLVTEWSEETGVEARTVVTGAPRPLLPEVEVVLFRTAQEALANVRKHARADNANVTLSYMNDRVVLDIVDNGVGFEPARLQKRLGTQDAGGFGLVAIRERIEQLGGTLRVESAPGEGTTLAAELPIAAQEADPRGPDARMPGTTESR